MCFGVFYGFGVFFSRISARILSECKDALCRFFFFFFLAKLSNFF